MKMSFTDFETQAAFGMSISNNMMQLPATMLKTPIVRYATKQATVKDASWNLANQRFMVSGPHSSITIVDLRGGTFPTDAIKVAMNSELSKLGVASRVDGTIHISAQITTEALFKEALQRNGIEPGWTILVILRDTDQRTYEIVKRVCDLKGGIVTVCCTAAKIQSSNNSQILANLCLKFNAKLGGTNHIIGDAQSPSRSAFATLDSTLVLGADVAHPGHGSKPGAPSVAAVVGSDSEEQINFPGSMRLNPSKQEVNTTSLFKIHRTPSNPYRG